MNKLFVINANCSWIRSLVGGLPEDWALKTYRVYSPQWLPNGIKDALRSFRGHRINSQTEETYVVVPGWNKLPRLSSLILEAVLAPSLRKESSSKTLLFTFPFYSHVARWARERFPRVRIAYHAHDPFEFYGYPQGYIRTHEDRLIPLCDRVFAISDKLRVDLQERYAGVHVEVLGNAVSESFLYETGSEQRPQEMQEIISRGRPLVGCVGQINQSYDWDLLERASLQNSQTHFVFIGNLFEEGLATERIRKLFKRDNVHWLGPKPHHELKAYMESCDILLNPLAVNAQNDRRDTLRLYDYLSTKATVVSTAIDGLRRHDGLVKVPSSTSEMIDFLARSPETISGEEIARRRSYLAANTWAARGRQLVEALIPRSS